MAQRIAAFAAPLLLSSAIALNNGLARIPDRGFNTWNVFKCGWTQETIYSTADAFVSTGLRDAGYVYVGVDDCWVRSPSSHFHSPPPTGPRLTRHQSPP